MGEKKENDQPPQGTPNPWIYDISKRDPGQQPVAPGGSPSWVPQARQEYYYAPGPDFNAYPPSPPPSRRRPLVLIGLIVLVLLIVVSITVIVLIVR